MKTKTFKTKDSIPALNFLTPLHSQCFWWCWLYSAPPPF